MSENPTMSHPDIHLQYDRGEWQESISHEVPQQGTSQPDCLTPPTIRSMGNLTALDDQLVTNVLRNRPTLRLGRQQSVRHKHRLPSRNDVTYKSFQHQPTGSAITGVQRVHRSSSMPMITTPSQVFLEDGDEEDIPFTRKNIRKSTRKITERIKTYQRNVKPVLGRRSIFADFKYIKWPKIKNRLKDIFSWELWRGHMKEVEGHFGTAVVSYFIFLRWVFIMNILIFTLWFGFVIVPNIVYIVAEDPPKIPSNLSCAYDVEHFLYPNYTCGRDNTSQPTVNYDVFFQFQESGPGYSCKAQNTSVSFAVQTCLFKRRANEDEDSMDMVADRESGTVVSVSNMPITDCTDVNGTVLDPFDLVEVVRLCSSSIIAHTEWYQYVINFALGEGLFNDTLLFYSRYSHDTEFVYNLPLAFFLLIVIVYGVSVILLVYKLGHAYNESYVQFGKQRDINFCNKVFTAWDFNITDPNTARLKKVQICTDFNEDIADYQKRSTRRTTGELAKVITIRIFTNLFTVIVLLGGGVAIYYAAAYGLTTQSSNSVFSLEGLVSPILITLFNLILPFTFSFLAQFERFKTQSGEIKMTLFRAIIVRLSSLIVVIATLYIVIQCTQDTPTAIDNTCGPILSINISVSTNRECPVCWEAYIGQELYKLSLINFAITTSSVIAVETLRNFVSRIRWMGLGDKIGKGTFDIPKSILDIIYTQSLLWLGFIFTPLTPAVVLTTCFMLFYVKKYSLLWNLVPLKRKVFRASRTDFAFIFLMLITLFLVILLIGFAIASLRPSDSCGPFRGRDYMYSIVPDLINRIQSCSIQRALEYFGSFGFQVPILVLLLLVIFAQYVILKARKGRFNLVKNQLLLEAANVTHIVGTLDYVLHSLAEHRATKSSEVKSDNKPNLNDTLFRVRESISEVEAFSVSGVSVKEKRVVRARLAQVQESISEVNTTRF